MKEATVIVIDFPSVATLDIEAVVSSVIKPLSVELKLISVMYSALTGFERITLPPKPKFSEAV